MRRRSDAPDEEQGLEDAPIDERRPLGRLAAPAALVAPPIATFFVIERRRLGPGAIREKELALVVLLLAAWGLSFGLGFARAGAPKSNASSSDDLNHIFAVALSWWK